VVGFVVAPLQPLDRADKLQRRLLVAAIPKNGGPRILYQSSVVQPVLVPSQRTASVARIVFWTPV
jgi:hypothetical protein